MLALTAWILAATVATTPTIENPIPKRFDVDCESPHALKHALAEAERFDEADIYLTGLCKGNFVIASDGVTLRAATPGSGLAAPDDDPGFDPVVEIVNAEVNLRGLTVQGGVIGVLAEGWDAEVLLIDADVHDQDGGVGVYAFRGAEVRLIDTTVRNGGTGIAAQSDALLNLQRVVVDGQQRVGVSVSEESSAALNDTTIENTSGTGLGVRDRSDVNVSGGTFRENGQAHIGVTDWSSVTLLSEVAIGSETDTTPFALGVNRDATIASFTTSVIYGDVSALVGGSIRLGNVVVEGDLTAVQFADAYVRDSQVTGVVACVDGSDVICSQTTVDGGVFGCPSPSCGSAAAEATAPAPALPEIEAPRLERFERTRSRR